MKEYSRGVPVDETVASLEKNSFSANNYQGFIFTTSSTQSDWDDMWAFINTGVIVWVNAVTYGGDGSYWRNLLMNSTVKLFCAVANDGTIYKIGFTEAKAAGIEFYIYLIKN